MINFFVRCGLRVVRGVRSDGCQKLKTRKSIGFMRQKADVSRICTGNWQLTTHNQ